MKRSLKVFLTVIAVAVTAFVIPYSKSATTTPILDATPRPTPLSGAALDLWRVEPGKVNQCASSKFLICGSFTLQSDPDGLGIKRGGGCLIFQNEIKVSCKSNSACVTRAHPAGYAYCARDKEGPDITTDANKSEPKFCWYKTYKTSGDPCIKYQTNLEKDVVHTAADDPRRVAPWVPKHSLPDPVRWRMVTCQNMVPGGCSQMGAVVGVDKFIRYGPIWTVP